MIYTKKINNQIAYSREHFFCYRYIYAGLKVSQDVWPWKTYPNHLLGGCYMIGKEAVARVLAVARTTPIMSAEDIFITGLCAIGGKVDIVNDKR